MHPIRRIQVMHHMDPVHLIRGHMMANAPGNIGHIMPNPHRIDRNIHATTAGLNIPPHRRRILDPAIRRAAVMHTRPAAAYAPRIGRPAIAGKVGGDEPLS